MLVVRSKKVSLIALMAIFLVDFIFIDRVYAADVLSDDVVDQAADQDTEDQESDEQERLKIINEIKVEGNTYVPTQALLNRIPYRAGEPFDKQRTNELIRSLYDLGYFKHIKVLIQSVGDDYINLIVIVQEKRLLSGVRFEGNKHLTEKEIEKKIDFSKIKTVDQDELAKYTAIVKKLYRDKDYHNVEVAADLEIEDGCAWIVFRIKEHHKAIVKRVFFTGNCYFTSKKLRSIIFTREDWVLGFLDRAGSYQPDAIEGDKQVIESFYQSNGFINARVVDAQVDIDPCMENIAVTFHIFEGEQYCISDIRVPGNECIDEATLLAALPIKVGDLYSKEKIRSAIEYLRLVWGDYGYIYADIEPSIQPNDDEKTVSLGFYTEFGPKVHLNRINIFGNKKTFDKVIRRQLTIHEGDMLTTKGMDESKSRVEALGYFDPRNGVNWKINRIAKDRADLDLLLKEVKTGRVEYQMGFGGSPRDFSSPMKTFNIKTAVSDTNLFGRGIHFSLSGEYSREERTLMFSLLDPWMFDRPIQAGVDLFIKRSTYDEFHYLEENNIHEQITGGNIYTGFLWHRLYDSMLITNLGFEGVSYKKKPVVNPKSGLTPAELAELQGILDERFASGDFVWLALRLSKDIRNHPLHPSRGHQWQGLIKIAIPNEREGWGFIKLDMDASWYTPLIGERDLVFGLHGHLGVVGALPNKKIPFRELYNVGGQASVRGYLFGEIGPAWVPTTPINRERNILGAKRAFWLNAELVFPITNDFAIKGAVFYDGGAGWDTPDADKINPARLRNNSFSFRHAVGFGVRMLRPTPAKIDWGFKLDKRKDESASEVHFSGYHEF